jgi:hypothetical protein
MAYLKPPVFVRKVFNPLAMRFGTGGAVTLAVPGRKSGNIQRVPVIPVEVDGVRYLVTPRGETDWVKNLRAAGGNATLETKAGTEEFASSEVPVAERGPILEAYKKVAGRAVKALFEQLPNPEDHPTFRLSAR